MAVEGIDVSNNNGQFNWAPWHGHILFAEIKATESLSFRDQEFPRNWNAAKEQGLFRFAYHFGHPGESPAGQARFFTEYVRDHGMDKTDNFVLDLEITGGLRPVDVSFWAHVFCKEMNRLNPSDRIVVQTNPAFAEAGNCAKLGPWHLWVMDWNVPHPVMPVGPWRDWDFWQYATGVVDRDRYAASAGDLREFCTSVGPGSR